MTSMPEGSRVDPISSIAPEFTVEGQCESNGSAPAETPVESMAPTIEALGSVVAGMTDSIGLAFQNMAETVNNANNLAASLNTMMESIVLRSLHVEVNVRSPAGQADRSGPIVSVTVHNNNPMDLHDLKLGFSIKKNQAMVSTTFNRLMDKCQTSCRCCDTNAPNLTVDVLKAGDKYQVEWYITLPHLDQVNITTQLSVKSPVFNITGTVLQTEHVSGIYTIHQVKRRFINTTRPQKIPETERQNESAQAEISAMALRQLFDISPVDGVPLGSEFVFESQNTETAKNRQIHFVVIGIGTANAANLVLRHVSGCNDADEETHEPKKCTFTGKRLLEEMQQLAV
ncbi:hypothetical protein SARC_00840 [Sphaeroforma arctica JP610]|uniref:Uncharacterized protein n=1 Tax=Sphaeroforma arctica JP610 TaxID=667725 RepID=A0A0L0GDE9_9EUKA|nr:hypothetical protein SARC_00840 [Sphaeroforma arctica JP610]KNC87030.1 hypothetical protein SARC_00840 [Sphaeroforma arctica JP610]|eukprot:XP_014160932.1 hypothetical protein SARC_00840 [Sphaeroforma arctica JP610]